MPALLLASAAARSALTAAYSNRMRDSGTAVRLDSPAQTFDSMAQSHAICRMRMMHVVQQSDRQRMKWDSPPMTHQGAMFG